MPQRVIVVASDWSKALAALSPATHRNAVTHARPLPPPTQPFLLPVQNELVSVIGRLFSTDADGLGVVLNDNAVEAQSHLLSRVFRPRLLLSGPKDEGQSYLAASILRCLEQYPLHALDLPALAADVATRSLEEALLSRIREALRSTPSILFIPHLDSWWKLAGTIPL